MTLTFKEVAEILKIIDASECEEVVLELEGTRLMVRRGGSGGTAAPSVSGSGTAIGAPAASRPAPGPGRPTAARATRDTPADAAAAGNGTAVRAPMVGTFFRKPSPNEPAFVEIGSRVKAGDPLCLIEVMKLYTTIEAPCDGIVQSIAAEDAALVEFDQLLFVVAPA